MLFILSRFQFIICVVKRFWRTLKIHSIALVKIYLRVIYSEVWLCGFPFIQFVTLLINPVMKRRIRGLTDGFLNLQNDLHNPGIFTAFIAKDLGDP